MGILEKADRLLRDVSQHRHMLGRQHVAEVGLLRQIDEQLDTAEDGLSAPRCGDRRLIMGLAAGYDKRELAPFICSLREHGYGGDVTLFTFNISRETRMFLDAHGVSQVSFETLPLLAMSMNSARMFRYIEFVRSTVFDVYDVSDYDYIMLTDVRDVIFQGNPFARVDGADLYYFLEADRTIGTCPINSRWMSLALGPEALRMTAQSPVSCAGTLIATPTGLIRYLLHMCRSILQAPPVARHSGIDQAIHNYIMVSGLVGNATVQENGGLVQTVPTDRPHGLVVMPDGTLRNFNGSISEIVHQYDREPALKAAINTRYGV